MNNGQAYFKHQLTVALLCLPILAAAQARSRADAEKIALRQWDNSYEAAHKKSVAKSTPMKYGDMSCFVVTRADKDQQSPQQGFVLVSDSENGPAVLAFSDEATFPTSRLPERIQTWMEAYTQIQSGDGNSVRQWMEASKTQRSDVAPLLGAREWDQNNPYNLQCPTVDGRRCPSGCVATALAQIMCYHKWPSTGTGTNEYLTNTLEIPVYYDFSSTEFEWDKLKDSYVPMEEILDEEGSVVDDGKFLLTSIAIDDNSKTMTKCYVRVNGLRVMGQSTFKGETALILTDDNGQFASYASSVTSVNSSFSGKLIDDNSFLLNVPASLQNGTYRAYCAVRAEGEEEWSLAYITGTGKTNYIPIEKHDGHFAAQDTEYPLNSATYDPTPIATLLQAVGAAVNMDYTPEASGSNDVYVKHGLVDFLGYDSNIFFASPDYFSDSEWHDMLQKELAEGRPVYYTGQGMTSGHAFVIDGFKTISASSLPVQMTTDDSDSIVYYHVNWGWGGLCNGYYLLNLLRPSSAGTGGSSGSNYSNKPTMLIGMKPEDGVSETNIHCGSIETLNDVFFPGQFMPMRLNNITVNSNTEYKGTLTLELHDTDGTGNDNPIILHQETIRINPSIKHHYISYQLPKDIPPGSYIIKMSCTANDGTEATVSGSQWPTITIKGIDEWNGGPLTQPLQELAIGGNLRLSTGSANDGVLTVAIDSLANPITGNPRGQLAVLICDAEGKMLAEPQETTSVAVGSYAVSKARVSTVISRNIPDGDYTLRIGMLPDGELLWTFCDRIHCIDFLWWASFSPLTIDMNVSDGIVSIVGDDYNVNPFTGADIPWENAIEAAILDNTARTDAIFDLQGRLVGTDATPAEAHGIYLLRKGHKTVKVLK